MKTFRLISILCLVMLIPAIGPARTWHVTPDSTGDVATIYEAIDSSACGDTVLVAPGAYCRERVKEWEYGTTLWIEMKDGISLISEGGPQVTTLVETGPELLNCTIVCDTVIGEAVLRGFTITVDQCSGARLNQHIDTGIVLRSSNVIVENNIILGFRYGIAAGGNSVHALTPVIRNNEIYNCGNGIDIGGVSTWRSPLIQGNRIHDCWWRGIEIRDCDAYIVGNTIESNGDAGLYFSGHSQSLLESNVIINNGVYGVYASMEYAYQAPCLNCALHMATANDVYANGVYDVYYLEGTGSGILGAPYNYWGTLCPDSSRFNGRVDWVPWVDSTHTVVCSDCDTCHHATEPTTWGSIKAMYK